MKRYVTLFITAVLSVSLLSGCGKIKISVDSDDKNVEATNASDEDYILPSDKESITDTQLSKLNKIELEYAYEEIFARYGKVFEDENFSRYFNEKDWYKPNPSFREEGISSLEKVNAETIKNYITTKFETTTQTTTQATTQAPQPKVQPKPADNEVDGENEEAIAKEMIQSALYEYCYSLCDAIYSGDYSVVSPYIASGSALETAQRKLVTNLYNKGTTEEFVSANVNRVEYLGNNKYAAYVTESETIYYASGKEETKTFNWKYTVIDSNGNWLFSNIE